MVFLAEDVLNKLRLFGTVEIETARFTLRRFQMSDAGDIYANWLSDEDSAKYNAWKVHSSIEVTKEYLSEWINSYKNKDYLHWAVEDKATKEVIGSVSVANIKKKKRCCEVGYTIAKNIGGKHELIKRQKNNHNRRQRWNTRPGNRRMRKDCRR
jgi:ribosomal-protein-alanine N-acetyltransferase